jgi:hypothetical protein
MVTKSQRAGWNGQRLSLGRGTVDVNLLECKNPCKPSFGARFTLGNGVVNIRGKKKHKHLQNVPLPIFRVNFNNTSTIGIN